MTDYLISTDPGEHHDLRITAVGEMVHLHSNSRTTTLSLAMAQELRNGLSAILSGHFTRALSETALRLETEETERRQHISSQAPSLPLPLPTLENL